MPPTGLKLRVKYIKFFNNQTWDIPKGWHVYRNHWDPRISASKEYDSKRKDTYIGQAIKWVGPKSTGKTKLVVEVTHSCD